MYKINKVLVTNYCKLYCVKSMENVNNLDVLALVAPRDFGLGRINVTLEMSSLCVSSILRNTNEQDFPLFFS